MKHHAIAFNIIKVSCLIKTSLSQFREIANLNTLRQYSKMDNLFHVHIVTSSGKYLIYHTKIISDRISKSAISQVLEG